MLASKLCLLVGLPFTDKQERALAGLADLQFPQQFRAYFDRAEIPSAIEAEAAASNMRPLTDKYRWVILLGQPIAEAFHVDLLDKDFFRWGPLPADDHEALSRLPYGGVRPAQLSDGPSCSVVPDFLDRKWWRSKKNCFRARRFWTELGKAIEVEATSYGSTESEEVRDSNGDSLDSVAPVGSGVA